MPPNRWTHYLNKPEYFYRPGQLFRRLLRGSSTQDQTEIVRLPWGLPLGIHPHETIGRAIATTGLYDLPVSETLWRLTDPGETTVDAGANLGHMTSILALRVGTEGQVWSFEPHPEIFAELRTNVQGWPATIGRNIINLKQLALSDHSGTGWLTTEIHFAQNRGTATLASATMSYPAPGENLQRFSVTLATLDEVLGETQSVGVLKIDVEGHELGVLQGARRLLETGKIRDIIFEDHAAFPTPTTEFLLARQYSLFRIEKQFTGPVLASPERAPDSPAWIPPSYLATSNPTRVRERLRPRGWQCLA
jgi:FkbM family methyltransferase